MSFKMYWSVPLIHVETEVLVSKAQICTHVLALKGILEGTVELKLTNASRTHANKVEHARTD